MTQETVMDQPEQPTVTDESVAKIEESTRRLEQLVRHTFKRNIHYGRVEGTPQDTLFDPGANILTSAFNCYAGQRRVIHLQDDAEKMCVVLEVPLVSRITGQTAATGVGAASTDEAKYKLHGDREDLLNTLSKMASKRGEVDAAGNLPGVSSVLRELFTEQAEKNGGTYSDTNYAAFWSEIRRLGYGQEEALDVLSSVVHERVVSMREGWIARGRSLQEAIDILRRNRAEAQK